MKLLYYVLHIETNRHNWPTEHFQDILQEFNTLFATQQGGHCFALCEDSCDMKLYKEFDGNFNFHHYTAYIQQTSDKEHDVLNLYHSVANSGEVIIVNNLEKWGISIN